MKRLCPPQVMPLVELEGCEGRVFACGEVSAHRDWWREALGEEPVEGLLVQMEVHVGTMTQAMLDDYRADQERVKKARYELLREAKS